MLHSRIGEEGATGASVRHTMLGSGYAETSGSRGGVAADHYHCPRAHVHRSPQMLFTQAESQRRATSRPYCRVVPCRLQQSLRLASRAPIATLSALDRLGDGRQQACQPGRASNLSTNSGTIWLARP
jgi:hypothetical protein